MPAKSVCCQIRSAGHYGGPRLTFGFNRNRRAIRALHQTAPACCLEWDALITPLRHPPLEGGPSKLTSPLKIPNIVDTTKLALYSLGTHSVQLYACRAAYRGLINRRPAVQVVNAPLTVVVGTLMHSSQILRTIAIATGFSSPLCCNLAVSSFRRKVVRDFPRNLFQPTGASALRLAVCPLFLPAPAAACKKVNTLQKRNNHRHEKQYLLCTAGEYICESGSCGVFLCNRGAKWRTGSVR
jgi:hypothetical protein